MPRVTLYTRAGCHLCDEAKAALDAASRRATFDLELVDIDLDERLRVLYNEEVPVISIDGRKAFKYHVTADELIARLKARS